MKRFLLVFVLLSIVFSSCNKNRVFKEYKKFDNYAWKRVDGNLFFDVPIEDISCNYNVILAVRYIDGIPLKNISAGISIYMPDGAEYYNEYTIKLRNGDGSFRGSVAGDIWDLSETVIKNMSFSKAGTFKFEVENLTGYKYETPGIMEIGLIIEKAEM